MTDGSNQDQNQEDANPGGQQGGDDPKDIEFTPEQRRELGRIVAKERRDAAAKATADAKAATDAVAAQAVKDREAADLKAKGDFEAVETTLKTDLQTAKDEAAGLKAKNDQLEGAVAAMVNAEWDALGDDAKDAYAGADDPLSKLEWLPKGKKLDEKLKKEPYRGNQSGPRSNGAAAPEVKSLINPAHFG